MIRCLRGVDDPVLVRGVDDPVLGRWGFSWPNSQWPMM